MRNPSTADGVGADPSGPESGTRKGQTRSNVKGETAPRLPHERDESSDSDKNAPREVIRQAGKDVESGKRATDRSEAADEVYGRTLRGSTPGAERDVGTPANKRR
jgi:hypothetical protein